MSLIWNRIGSGMCAVAVAAAVFAGAGIAHGQAAGRGGGGTAGRSGDDGLFGKGSGGPKDKPGETVKNGWPVMSEQQLAEALAQVKADAEAATKNLTRPMKLTESDHFLLFSDTADAATCSKLLERAYGRAASILGLKDANVFRGKAVVYVFERRDDYKKFDFDDGGGGGNGGDRRAGGSRAIPGAIRLGADGGVTIAIARHPDDSPATIDGRTEDQRFARALAHRAVEGVLHRYRTPEPLPSWVRDGLGQAVASELVPLNRNEAPAWQVAKVELFRSGGVGNMFSSEGLYGAQLAVADTLAAYMVRTGRPTYVKFVNGLKDGMSWQEGLRAAYGHGRSALLRGYGKATVNLNINEPD